MTASLACPSASDLASFVDGRLGHDRRDPIVAHLLACSECAEVVAGTAAFEEEQRHRRAMVRRHWRRVWIPAAAVLVLAVSLGVLRKEIWSQEPIDRLAVAARAVRFRPVEARLVGFTYAPLAPAMRSSSSDELDPSILRLHGVAGEILQQQAASTNAHSLHAAGVAYVLVGNEARAVEKLEAATRQQPRDPQLWTDLAAARLALARQKREILPSALAAADVALGLEPRRAEALFNRARILDTMQLTQAAKAAYEQFIAVEPGSEWAAEARQRIQELSADQTSDAWGEALSRLEGAAARGNTEVVRAIVTRFPQDARTSAETELLGEWADAEQRGNHPRAAARLLVAKQVSDALREINGESLLHGAVAAIEISRGSTRADLIAAHLAYRQGRTRHAQRNISGALPQLQQARDLFRRAHSPMWMLAAFYAAVGTYDRDSSASALRELSKLRKVVPPECRALHGLMWWQDGTVLGRQRRVYESIAAYRQAIHTFEAIGERNNVAAVRAVLAAVLELAGERASAWDERLRSFAELSRAADLSRLQLALSSLAGQFFRRGDSATAAAMARVASEVLPGAANPRIHADALLWRSLASHQRREPTAWSWLAAAHREAERIPEETLRHAALADLLFAEAIMRRDTDPAGALPLLTGVLAETITARRFFARPEVLLARSTTLRRLERNEEALSDLRDATDYIAALPSDQREVSAAVVSDVFDASMAALAERRLVPEIVETAETARAQSAFPGARMCQSQTECQTIPEATLLLEYAALPDQLLIMARGAAGTRLHRMPIRRAELAGLVADWVRTLSSGNASPDPLAERLGQIFLGPIDDLVGQARVIVVGLDPRLGPLPFAALRHDGAYLIEGVQILSIAVCGTPCAASLEPVHDSALVVGNPAGDEAAGSSPLDHVKKEAGEIATLYPEVVTLIGNEANRQNVLRHLSERSVFHFAGHAVANGHNPALTFLTLAGENGERGRLYTYEIANMDLSTVSLVVLAGCKTAASAGPAAFPSLASAFVAAGAKNSIGTLWNTPDRVAREFSLRLHHGLRKGDRPVGAVVRDVQLAMLRSVDPELRTPGAWGAFQLIGTARETSTERSSYGPRHSLLRPDVTRSR